MKMSVSRLLANNMGKAEQYQKRQSRTNRIQPLKLSLSFHLSLSLSLNQHSSIYNNFLQDSFVTQACGHHPKAQNGVFAFFSKEEPSVFSPTQVIVTKDIYNCCNII